MGYVRPHWSRLHVVARRYAVNEADAVDLVQETLLRAWRAYAPTESGGYTRAWLLTIMRNIVFEWQRAAGRRVRLVVAPLAELTELAPSDPDLSDPVGPLTALPSWSEARFREFLDDRIVIALDALNPAFREVLVLAAAGGLSYREIAEVLDCPVGTVMSRMARARRELRARIADLAPSTRLGPPGRSGSSAREGRA